MFKKILLVLVIALICTGNAIGQLNKSEIKFLGTSFKVQFNGDAMKGVRVDGMPNTYGLPSVKDFVKKFKSSGEKSGNSITVTLVDIGARSIYDLCSNGSPVQIWQDPALPNNVHAVFVSSPPGDPSYAVRLAKYYLSTDRGATWTFVADVPSGVRSGFPAIDGFSDGSALIVNHSADGGGITRGQAYKDAAAGLGSFTRLDAPGNNAYIWPRAISTLNTTLTNKFVFIGSINGSDTTRFNTCTNVNATPGTWLGWTTFQSDQAETYALGRGTDGRIGLAFKNNDGIQPGDYGDVWFMESVNNGTSFSTPVKIFDANFSTDSLGCIRGISMTYKGNAPAVAFETVKQTQEGSFFPNAPAKIRFWSNTLPGSDPNRSVVVADTGRVGYHPYIGVNDVLSSLSRPNIGVSSDGNVLFVAFMVPSDNVGGSADSTTFSDIWLAGSINGGLTWPQLAKLNPVTPIKDWRYVSVSKWNDNSGADYYCNMVTLRGHIPGSYVNGVGNGESNEEYWFIRAKVQFSILNPITWQSVIKCNDAGSGLDSLFFGTGPNATNGLDISLGESELPPIPPSSIFDYRFILPTNPAIPSKKDYRNDTNKTITWRMTFQPTASGYPMTFYWNPVLLPTGSFILKDEITGTLVNVNMKDQSSYTLSNSGITALKIEYTHLITVPVTVSASWNMISVPVNANNMNVTTLFPDATSQAYGFNNGYVTTSVLSAGKGYFLKFGNNNTYNISGTTVNPKQIPVVSGWNIIGPFETSVSISSISSNPPGIVISNYYGYNSGYVNSTVLDPGKGYWVKTSQAGTLTLPSVLDNMISDNIAAKTTSESIGWTTIRVSDADGKNGLLLIHKRNEMKGNYELPPLPPVGLFDVRFESQMFAEASGKNHGVKISSAHYPIIISVENLNGLKLRIKDKISGDIVNSELTEGRNITVNQPVENFDIIDENCIPSSYNLEQNYPNPFNPVTTIKYQIPEDAYVKLVVFDLLGRKVQTIVNSKQNAGYYSYIFDASLFSSGVYLFRLESGSYSSVKKMMVIK